MESAQSQWVRRGQRGGTAQRGRGKKEGSQRHQLNLGTGNTGTRFLTFAADSRTQVFTQARRALYHSAVLQAPFFGGGFFGFKIYLF